MRFNYWDCPIINYSSTEYTHDYLTAKGDCGKNINWEKEKSFFFKNKKWNLDSSCQNNSCLNGGQCSTRLDGNYHCECTLEFAGTHCGWFLFSFFLIKFEMKIIETKYKIIK